VDSSQIVSELRRALALFILSMALFSVVILSQLLDVEGQTDAALTAEFSMIEATALAHEALVNTPSPDPSHTSVPSTPEATSLNHETLVKTPSTTPSHARSTSDTPRPKATPALTITPIAIASLDAVAPGEQCNPQIYLGIRHCVLDDIQILRLDPQAPFLHIRTVLPMGYDRDGTYAECNDLLVPDNVPGGSSTGPGCHVKGYYPGERIENMAMRYPDAVAAFNGDFFSSTYAHGAMGLTVREGQRLDGGPEDQDGREIRRSSLSISADGDVRIGIVPRETIPEDIPSWSWVPDPDDFYTTVGGLPMLVSAGRVVDIRTQCDLEEGWCADPFLSRARTAVGVTRQGELIVVVIPEIPGISLSALADVMISLGAWDALNLDGGGSSQLWYDGSYLVFSSRPVAEGLIVQAVAINQWQQEAPELAD